jgi:methylphosphotriester-DNA--protein-cysteine methyltransferase
VSREAWKPIVELIDLVTSDPKVIDQAVRDVRVSVPEMGRLPPEDIARHARALLAAAVRAIAERRGPSEAELDFIEDLAVTRARQQIPIQAVLTAVHVASRQVWQRSRELAEDRGVPLGLVVDARDLYDEWAEQVRGRLIVAHRTTEIVRAQSLRDRRVELLRRALEGGAAATLAAAEAGLDTTGRLWVVYNVPEDDAAAGQLEQRLRGSAHDLFGLVDDALIGVLASRPRAEVEVTVGLVGPLPADELDVGSLWARWAHAGGRLRGRSGLVALDDVAVEAALASRSELGRASAVSRLAPLADEGDFADAVVATVIAYAEHDRRVEATAERLFVHPNTVRHRLRRFTDLTGIELDSTFGAVAAWWAAHGWTGDRAGPGADGVAR